MLLLIAGLVLFIGGHSVSIVSRSWRDGMVGSMGAGPWKGLYSLVAAAGLVLVAWGFGQARATAPILYAPPQWLQHLAGLLMLASTVCLAVAILPGGRLKRLLKHPLLASVKIWAFAHLLANGDLASVLMFGAFLAWAVVARIWLKRRGAPIAEAGPPLWDAAAIAAGIGLWLLIVWRLHELLIGVVPFV